MRLSFRSRCPARRRAGLDKESEPRRGSSLPPRHASKLIGWKASHARLGDLRSFRRRFGQGLLRLQEIPSQLLLQDTERSFGIVGVLKQIQIIPIDGPVFLQRFEIQYLAPEFCAVQHDYNLAFEFLRLSQRQNLEQLVHGSESTRENNQCFRQVRKPEFAHEEVVELER